MCKNCGTPKCTGCKKKSSNTEIASLQNEISELKDIITNIETNAKFLLCGHPILQLQEAGDIACFDVSTGLGSKCWEGWAICDGATQKRVNGSGNLVTPNLIDRFPVQAGGLYDVDDTGGENTHALTTAELAAHNHVLNDPGHIHSITDPGHDHFVIDPGHAHTLTTDDPGDHQHDVLNLPLNVGGVGGAGAIAGDGTFGGSGLSGAHTHTGNTNSVDTNVTVDVNQTDITIVSHQTGITMADAGSGTAHENRPPYYALLFVIKL